MFEILVLWHSSVVCLFKDTKSGVTLCWKWDERTEQAECCLSGVVELRKLHVSPSFIVFCLRVGLAFRKVSSLDVLHISLQKSLFSVMGFCAIPFVCL